MTAVILRNPKVDLVLAADPSTRHRVQTISPDMTLWDRTRIRNKWPKADESPVVFQVFVSWAACRRLGIIEPTLTFEDFDAGLLECIGVDDPKPLKITCPTCDTPHLVDADTGEPWAGADETGRPTLPAVEAG